MGLQMSFTKDEIIYPNCYIFISLITMMPAVFESPSGISIYVNYYPDISSFQNGLSPINQSIYSLEDVTIFDVVGDKFDIAYNYLLTIPEFEGSQIV